MLLGVGWFAGEIKETVVIGVDVGAQQIDKVERTIFCWRNSENAKTCDAIEVLGVESAGVQAGVASEFIGHKVVHHGGAPSFKKIGGGAVGILESKESVWVRDVRVIWIGLGNGQMDLSEEVSEGVIFGVGQGDG